MRIHASCLWGDVAWEADGPLELMSHCHCPMCRKAHGAAFATYAAAPVEGFRYSRGEERIRRYESAPGSFRSFCGRCGSALAGQPTRGRLFMPVGCLDDDPGGRAREHIFVGSKAPWYEIADDLSRHEEYPPA